MDKKTIKEYIRALEHITSYLRNLLDEELRAPEAPVDQYSSLVEFTDLRMLAKSDSWPTAVPADLICDEKEDEKLNRAAGILNNLITEDLKDKKFLDYGCGEGHVAFIAGSVIPTKISVGFDIEAHPWNFEKFDKITLTSNFEQVLQLAPFDVILLNDVFDHSKNPIKLLEYAKKLKTPMTGKVFMRCHPFTSRHGTHLYKELNKAYLHLVFTEEELQVLGLKGEFTMFSYDPLKTYREHIQAAGFTILKEEIVTHHIEMFFTHRPQVLRRIKERMKKNKDAPLIDGDPFPREILEIQFVDYVLV